VQGALRCLSLFAGDIDDSQLPRVVSVLFPELLTIVASGDAYEPSVQRKALSIVHSSVATLGIMSGMYLVSLSYSIGLWSILWGLLGGVLRLGLLEKELK
jgi:hypothetical protein